MKFATFCGTMLPNSPTDLQLCYADIVDNKLPANIKYFNFDAAGSRGQGLTLIKCLHIGWLLSRNPNYRFLFILPHENAVRDMSYKLTSLNIDRSRVTIVSPHRIHYSFRGITFDYVFVDEYTLTPGDKKQLRHSFK